MENCPQTGIMVGRQSHILLAYGCQDVRPDPSEFKYMGSTTTKGFDFNPSTTTSEADTGSSYVATLVTTSDPTINADFEVNLSDGSDEFGYHALAMYFHKELNARRQPALWVQRIVGETVITMYANITALSESGGTNDIITGSVEFKPYDGSTVSLESTQELSFTTDLPSTKSVVVGSNAVFGPVVVSGGIPPYSYQWYYEGVAISSSVNATAVTDTLTNTAVSGSSAGDYYVIVSDSSSPDPDTGKSNECKLSISAASPLSLSTNLDPTETVTAGSALTLTVVAAGGVSPLAYQWRKDGVIIAGALSATYTKATAAESDEGVYTVTVSDSATPNANKLTSVSCAVTVN